ncbi:MAG: nucleotidyltransferase family protein [Bacteroidetes bacterium]|nr:nucleotidyltransferase family protein [Bacteroidota bacterium]
MNSKALCENYDLYFEEIILSNYLIKEILQRIKKINLPDWYLGAGCIAQTIWNYLHGYDLNKNINDYDVVYFDRSDLSFNSENKTIQKINNVFKDLPVKLDIKNQARVHLWYEEHFGYSINSYENINDAINTWPTTATCIGVKITNGKFLYYSTFGLNDIFNMVVKPNKVQITKEIYENKTKRWEKCWPMLKILEW